MIIITAALDMAALVSTAKMNGYHIGYMYIPVITATFSCSMYPYWPVQSNQQ